MTLKNYVRVLVPKTGEYVTLHGARDFASVSEGLSDGGYYYP